MPAMRWCPDCGVELEEMEMQTGEGFELDLVTNEPTPGILRDLSAKEKEKV